MQKLAKRFLFVPCTSASFERLFLQLIILLEKRIRLDPDTVDELLVLHCFTGKKDLPMMKGRFSLFKRHLEN